MFMSSFIARPAPVAQSDSLKGKSRFMCTVIRMEYCYIKISEVKLSKLRQWHETSNFIANLIRSDQILNLESLVQLHSSKV